MKIRRAMIASLLLLLAHPAFAAWTLVGAGSPVNGTVPVTASYPSGSSSDIIICATAYDSAGATLSITGFTTIATSNGNASVGLFWMIAGSTSSGSVSAFGAAYAECSRWSGGPSTLTGNVSNTASSSGNNLSGPFWPSMTIADNNTLVIVATSAYWGGGVAGDINRPSPWTGTLGVAHTGFDFFGAEYVIQTTATNITTGTWTISITGTGNNETIVAALKAGTGSSCTNNAYTSTGASATPTAGSTSVYLSNGSFGTVDCSSTNYYQLPSGAIGVN